MGEEQAQFERRIQRLNRKHQSMTRGYAAHMRSDGLIVMKPRRSGFSFPLRGVLLVLAALFGFKAFLFASIGPDSYADRIAKLSEGTIVEKAGAWVMQVEPVTASLATQIGPILR